MNPSIRFALVTIGLSLSQAEFRAPAAPQEPAVPDAAWAARLQNYNVFKANDGSRTFLLPVQADADLESPNHQGLGFSVGRDGSVRPMLFIGDHSMRGGPVQFLTKEGFLVVPDFGGALGVPGQACSFTPFGAESQKFAPGKNEPGTSGPKQVVASWIRAQGTNFTFTVEPLAVAVSEDGQGHVLVGQMDPAKGTAGLQWLSGQTNSPSPTKIAPAFVNAIPGNAQGVVGVVDTPYWFTRSHNAIKLRLTSAVVDRGGGGEAYTAQVTSDADGVSRSESPLQALPVVPRWASNWVNGIKAKR